MQTVLAEDTREQVLEHIAEAQVDRWFKTDNRTEAIDFVKLALTRYTDDELVCMIAD